MQLNFFPITINSTKYRLASEPYSVERLKELRSSYNKTHSFFRHEDKIFISNKEGNDERLFSSFVDLNANSDEQVTSSLIKHIFFRTFKDRFKNYIPVDFYPFRFFSSQEKDDIIRSVLPDDLKDRVAFKKMIEVQLRLIRNGTELQYGFVINTSRNWVLPKTAKN